MEITRNSSSTRKLRSTPSSASGGVFDCDVLEERPGLCVLRVNGKGAVELFSGEAGGHRWQAVSPTDKRGRMHTSTITIAVLPEATEVQVQLNEEELEWQTCRGSGAGGQHRNVTASAFQVKHVPTGIIVRAENERSQHLNKQFALETLRARLWERRQTQLDGDRAANRRRQVGSGMRGDKRRTIRTQDDSVVDHETGRTWRFRDYIRGNW